MLFTSHLLSSYTLPQIILPLDSHLFSSPRMQFLSIWQQVLVNKSNRPILIQGEHNVYIRDGVGLYQGRLKIKSYQNGRLYLTNQRIIWLDSLDKMKPIALNMADLNAAEVIDGFLRSSPKVKVYLVEQETAPTTESSSPMNMGGSRISIDGAHRTATPIVTSLNWVCVICLYSNQINSNIDLSSTLPPCVSCGIQPSRTQLEKVLKEAEELSGDSSSSGPSSSLDACPKCTFVNHPSMRYCELCGTALRLCSSSLMKKLQSLESLSVTSLVSENPMGLVLEETETYTNNKPYVKFSFRKGGEVEFHRHLVEQIQAHQWLALEAKGGISGNATKVTQPREPDPQKDLVGGIRGLEKLDELKRQQNELILSLSLRDFEQLMYKAQDILGLASTFQSVLKPQRHTFGKATSTIPPLNFNKSSNLYHQELARHISEFLLSFELTSMTSMITLQDLFASYNRFLILSQGFGTELVTPQDLNKSLEFLEKLKLPIRIKTYLSGLAVIARRAHDLQGLHRAILQHAIDEENSFTYQKFRSEMLADSDGYMRDKYRAFHGLTVSQIADHYGWSPAVCAEELERCIEEQLLVVDENILGTFYFANIFDAKIAARLKDEKAQQDKAHLDVLKEQKVISNQLKSSHDAGQNLLRFSEYGFGFEGAEGSSQPSLLPSSLPESLNQLSGLKF